MNININRIHYLAIPLEIYPIYTKHQPVATYVKMLIVALSLVAKTGSKVIFMIREWSVWCTHNIRI